MTAFHLGHGGPSFGAHAYVTINHYTLSPPHRPPALKTQVAQVSLELAVLQRMILNSLLSHLHLNAGIAGLCHHVQSMDCWRWNPGLNAMRSTYGEPHLQPLVLGFSRSRRKSGLPHLILDKEAVTSCKGYHSATGDSGQIMCHCELVACPVSSATEPRGTKKADLGPAGG